MFIKPLHSFVFLVFVGGIVGWASFPTRPRGPRLKVESVVEMGILEHDEYRTQKVRLTNDGDDVLVLEKPLTGCACTSGELSKSRLRPGDVAEVTITYHAAQAAGTEVHQAVMIHSNCQEIPKRQVTLHGRMRGAVFAAPSMLSVGRVRPGEAWKRSVRIRHSDRDVRFNVVHASTNLNNSEVTIRSVSELEHEITVYSTGDNDVGAHRGLIFVESSISAKLLEIPVSVDVRSELRAVPSPLLFSKKMTGESGVSTYNEESFAVTGPVGMKLIPELEPPFVVSEASPDSSTADVSESQLRFRFKVRLADAPAVNRRGTILFRVEGVSHETSFSVPYLVVP